MKISQILEYDINSYRAGDNRNPRSPDYDESFDAAQDPSGAGDRTPAEQQQVADEASRTDPKTGWTTYWGEFLTPELAQQVAASIKQNADAVDTLNVSQQDTEDGPIYRVDAEYRFWQGRDNEAKWADDEPY